MIPAYIAKPLSAERMTEEVMMEALVREDVAVSAETARQTCWLLAQLGISLKSFEDELFSDSHHKEYSAMKMAEFLTRDIEEILRGKEAANYRQENFTNERTEAAMSQVGIKVGIDLMESLLAAYAVGGRELLAEEWMPYLKENNLTVDSIAVVANCY